MPKETMSMHATPMHATPMQAMPMQTTPMQTTPWKATSRQASTPDYSNFRFNIFVSSNKTKNKDKHDTVFIK
jgi:hypothetical protein